VWSTPRLPASSATPVMLLGFLQHSIDRALWSLCVEHATFGGVLCYSYDAARKVGPRPLRVRSSLVRNGDASQRRRHGPIIGLKVRAGPFLPRGCRRTPTARKPRPVTRQDNLILSTTQPAYGDSRRPHGERRMGGAASSSSDGNNRHPFLDGQTTRVVCCGEMRPEGRPPSQMTDGSAGLSIPRGRSA